LATLKTPKTLIHS